MSRNSLNRTANYIAAISCTVFLFSESGPPAVMAQPPAAAADDRLPVPDAAARKRAAAIVLDLFKPSDASTAQQHLSLAREFLKTGRETTDDPAARFVLLDLARQQAASAGEIGVAFSAIDQLTAEFEISDANARVDTIRRVAAVAELSPKNRDALAASGLALVDHFLDQLEFDHAKKMTGIMSQIARKTRHGDLLADLKNRQQRIVQAEGAVRNLMSALETLQGDPDDKPANTAAGRFWFYEKGDWDSAVKFLAKSDDEILLPLVQHEIANPETSEAKLQLADAWWEQAEVCDDSLPATRMFARARHWYKAALPDLAGLAQEKAKHRIESANIKKAADVVPEELDLLEDGIRDARWMGRESLDILPLVELPRDQLEGEWSFNDGTLVSPKESFAKIRLPIIPPEEYELTLEVEPQGEEDGFRGFIVTGPIPVGTRFSTVLDLRSGSSLGRKLFSGLGHHFRDVFWEQNPTRYSGEVLPRNQPNVVVLSVRKTSIEVQVNDRKIVDYQDDPFELSVVEKSGEPSFSTLVISSGMGQVSIRSAKLKRLVTRPSPYEVAPPSSRDPNQHRIISWFRREKPRPPSPRRGTVYLDEVQENSYLGRLHKSGPGQPRTPSRTPATKIDHMVSLSSWGRVTYSLGGRFRQFTADVGFAARRSNEGPIPDRPLTFEVYGDGELLATQLVESSAQDVPIRADISGVQTLVLRMRNPHEISSGGYWRHPMLKK